MWRGLGVWKGGKRWGRNNRGGDDGGDNKGDFFDVIKGGLVGEFNMV